MAITRHRFLGRSNTPFVRILLIAALLHIYIVPSRASEPKHLVILHTADLHGRILEADGGLARIATVVNHIRAKEQTVLLLDAGDALQGNALMSLSEGATMTKAMNALGYDAMALGNHEFDFGQDALIKNLASIQFPVLAANVAATNKQGHGISGRLGRVQVQSLDGIKVGIIGLAPQTLRLMMPEDRYQGLDVFGEREAVEKEIKKISQTVDLLIVLAHVPWTRLEGLVKKVPAVDVAIGGHTHEEAAGFQAGNTLIAQAGKHAECLGRIDIQLDKDKTGRLRPVKKSGRLIRITSDIAADTTIMNAVASDLSAAEKVLARVVGETQKEMQSGNGKRPVESDLVDLTLDAMGQATGADIALAGGWTEEEVGFDTGPITLGEIYEAYPYDDRLYVATMTGAAIRELLEKSTAWYLSADAWRMLFAGGVSYEVHLGNPYGERVRAARIGSEPLYDTALYRIAMDGYAAAGGVYPSVKSAVKIEETAKTLRGSVIEYLKERRPGPGERMQWSRFLMPEDADPKRTDVNAAELSELLSLPDMTEDLALSIMAARRERGLFTDVSDLLKIPGMTNGTYLALREHLTVRPRE